jgi:hypothetical protein
MAIIGVIVNSAVAGLPKTYASGLMNLVAHSIQDVYLLQSNITKLKSDVTKL